MVTITIILVLLLVPASRGIIAGILRSIFGAIGLTFLVTRNSPSGRKRGL